MALVQKEIKRVTIRPNGTEKQIRPAGWQPGVNTLAYYPLNGDMNDYSGNGYNLTGSPSSYETLNSGIEVGIFNGKTSVRPGNIYPNTAPFMEITQNNTNNFTFSFWTNIQTFAEETGIMYIQGNGSYRVMRVQVNPNNVLLGLGAGAGSNFADKKFNTSNSTNTWYHIVLIYSYNSGSPYVKCYKNNVLLGTISTTAFTNWTGWDCGVMMYDHSYSSNKKISNFIIEDKEWTAQEISDYYNQTKSLYGIS